MKIVNTRRMVDIVAQGKRERYNRLMPKDILHGLDRNGFHLLTNGMVVDDSGAIRCDALLKMGGREKPLVMQLDVPLSMYNYLKDFQDVMNELKEFVGDLEEVIQEVTVAQGGERPDLSG